MLIEGEKPYLGLMHVEVCPIGRTGPTLLEAHWTEAVPLPPVKERSHLQRRVGPFSSIYFIQLSLSYKV